MLDSSPQPALSGEARTAPDVYDFAVVGAGVCGLNALFAAAEHLPASARVAVIERRDAPGGMWRSTYDYVHLHQPHPMFTVGNIPWGLGRPPEYLAKGTEVRDHLAHCYGTLRERLRIDEYFGHDALSVEEIETPQGIRVRLKIAATEGGPEQEILAERVIHSAGLKIQDVPPLDLASDKVISTMPNALAAELDANPAAPVYVVGGGKTGMDTLTTILNRNDNRRVVLVNGPGTFFYNRTKNFPKGIARWTSGVPVSRFFADIVMRYDGTNERAVLDWANREHGVCPTGQPGQIMFGVLSEQESARIRDGLDEILPGYLQDVTDGPDGPVMRLRDGNEVPVPEGAIFVNCSGSLFLNPMEESPPPCVSEHGRIVTIGTRDTVHFLSSVAGYFLGQMMFLDKLGSVPLYAMDLEALNRQNRQVFFLCGATLSYLNLLVWIEHMPFKVLDNCWLDLDRWYPLPRRAAQLIRLKMNNRAHQAHCRQVLDDVAARYGIACQPIC